jgi:4'-phosphopantetheinyl transferase
LPVSPVRTDVTDNSVLSHADGLVVLAVARDIELGVDTENIERKAALDVASHCVSPAEAQGPVRLAIDASGRALGGDAAQRWNFWQLRPSPKHLVALCAAPVPSASATTRIVSCEIAPLQYRPLAVRTTRTSAGI